MESKKRANVIIPFLLFVLLGAVFAGTGGSQKQFITIKEECFDGQDNDGDSDTDIGLDLQCTEYPYADGNGESNTQQSSRWASQDSYQTGYDLTADYVREGIEKNCGGSVSNCGIPNVSNEVELYCYFESNASGVSFSQMVQGWAIQTSNDDGSYQMIQDLCYQFGGSGLTELPVINYSNYQ